MKNLSQSKRMQDSQELFSIIYTYFSLASFVILTNSSTITTLIFSNLKKKSRNRIFCLFIKINNSHWFYFYERMPYHSNTKGKTYNLLQPGITNVNMASYCVSTKAIVYDRTKEMCERKTLLLCGLLIMQQSLRKRSYEIKPKKRA